MSDTWWAAVRYTDGKSENVSVSKIKKFSPNHLKDYECSRKYVVKTIKWNKEAREEKYKAYILRLAESLPALEESLLQKRPSCPPLEVRDSDGPMSSTHDKAQLIDPIEVQRFSQKDTSNKKKRASDNMMSTFVAQAKLNYDSCSASTARNVLSTEDMQSSISDGESQQNKDALIMHLTDKVKILENELASRSDNVVLKKLEAMETKMAHLSQIETRMAAIEKLLSKYEPDWGHSYVTRWLKYHNNSSISTLNESADEKRIEFWKTVEGGSVMNE